MSLAFFRSAIRLCAAFLFGATGETITEKSGHLNLGTPGVMCMGAVGGVIGVSTYCNSVGNANNVFMIIFMGLLFCLLFGAIAGVIYSFLTVSLRANQNITGLALTTFGIGFSKFYIEELDRSFLNAASAAFKNLFTFYPKLGWFGELFLSYGFMVYLSIIIAVLTALILRKTKVGLKLRSVGENPATADACGINVSRYRYLATITGCSISALGGMFYIMDYLSGNWEYTIDAIGWLAVALVIFTVWRTDLAILGSIIFSGLFIASSYLNVPLNVKEIFKMLPYVVTIIILIVTSLFGGKLVQPPASLGINYFREDR